MLDRSSIHRALCFASDRSSIAPRQIHFCRDLVLDRSSTTSSIHWVVFSIYRLSTISDLIFLILSWQKLFSFTPNTFLSLQSLYPYDFWPRSCLSHLVCVLQPFIYMHTCILDLSFGVFENFWGFLDFCVIVGLGVVDLMLYAHALHSHCIITMFHAF